MKYRLAIILISLTLLGIGGYFLDEIMTLQAWGSHNGQQWHIDARGWKTLLHAWPVALGGAFLGGILMLFVLGYLLSQAQDEDHQKTIERLNQDKEHALEKASNAEKQANARFIQKTHDIEAREKQLNTLQGQLKSFALECQNKVNLANAKAKEGEEKVVNAETRRHNASAAAERRKRKLERLKIKKP